ncbi:MAG: nucleotidyltransferase family protein [Deltaproteobacteria bacterium]|nr:nucleotidyltransferase family protein [Candidatus Zymogenaceae bacterium]
MYTVRSVTTRALSRYWRGVDAAAAFAAPDHIPSGLVTFAAARGSLGPVADALEVWGLAELLPDGDRADMKAALVRSELFNHAQSRAVSEFLSLSGDAGVPVVLFKGHDLINRYYTKDILRPTTDADILIREGDRREVERLLSASGFSPPNGSGSSWTRGALAIDVHTEYVDARRISGRRHLPRIPTEHIFGAAKPQRLHGAPYLSPDPYHTLVLTALHALTHSYLMDFWFLDIAVVIASMGEDFSCDTLLAEADRYGLGFSVEPMLWALGSLFLYPLPEGFLETVRPSPLLRRLIRSATERTEYLFFGEAVLGLHVDTYKKKFYYFRGLIFPGREVVARELGVRRGGSMRLLFLRAAHLLRSLGRIVIHTRGIGGSDGGSGKKAR